MSVTEKDIELFSKRAEGKQVQKVLKALERNTGFVEAFNSKVGQEIYLDVVAKMESMLEKIVNEEATSQELAEFRAYRNIVSEWAKVLNNYQDNMRKLKGGKT